LQPEETGVADNLETEFDVIVAGAGMAGLCAALEAASAGAGVLVLEKGPGPGGNANLAAGMVLGSSDFDGLRAYIPDGEPHLQRLLCARFEAGIEWLKSFGLPFAEPISFGDFRVIHPMDAGRPGDRRAFMALLADRVREAGAEIRTDCAMREARPGPGGFTLATPAGEVNASSLILATGGFQGAGDLLVRYLGKAAAAGLRIRSVAECTGDGLRAALALGARESANMDAFYGHTMGDAPLPMNEFQPSTPYFARNGILLNAKGRRFVDEGSSLLEEANPQAACRQPGENYYLIFDAGMLAGHGGTQGSDAPVREIDWMERAGRLAMPLHLAPTLEEMIDHLAQEGLPAEAVTDELEAYRRAVTDGTHAQLDPPRAGNVFPLDTPPYYALRCSAGITATCGGIAIDEAGRVQAGDGGTFADGGAIPGLYAAGIDAGGVFGNHYGGFLGWALVSGRICGASAAGLT
jgi:succinate dehydrogenase/fumarate reductase flavoprotein subunit